ncbi:MAG: hypothetical protein ACK5OX_03690 [Desertimonas sp.]
MFNHLHGLQLHRYAFPDAVLTGPGIPAYGVTFDEHPVRRGDRIRHIQGHDVDITALQHDHRAGEFNRLHSFMVGCRLDLIPDLRAARAMFPAPLETRAIAGFGDDDLVIHIRTGNTLAQTFSDYPPLPIGYYRRLISETELHPVFTGQLELDHPYLDALRCAFPDATFARSLGLIEDFERLRRSRHLALSVSTFSWMAAWLSQAETIHLPIAGFFHPHRRADIYLLPIDDPRYRFTLFAPQAWKATDDQWARLTHGGEFGTPMSANEIRRTLRPSGAIAWSDVGVSGEAGGPYDSARTVADATGGIEG